MQGRRHTLGIAALTLLAARVASAQPAPAPEATPPDRTKPNQWPDPTPAEPPAADPPATEPVAEPTLEEEPELELDTPSRPTMDRNFAGSIQLDYMALPDRSTGREVALDGATAEASLKLTSDFRGKMSASVKACFACHGFEVGMALFDVRVADELNVRVGRFTPAFGEFPERHDPSNHRTSDKPLIWDMGRMVRMTEWNEGVLPAPWVDNGIEVSGTRFFGDQLQADYAVFAIGGPRAAADPVDFDFRLSRSGESYYIDNNSRPVLGGQLVASYIGDDVTVALGGSAMRGTYDPEHRLPFSIYGAHGVVRVRDMFLRLEVLSRRTRMALGDDPATRFKYGPGEDGTYDPHMVKDGGYAELEVPIGDRFTAVLREDALRRRGNVLATSALRSDSAILRHTAGVAIRVLGAMRLKLSVEYYDFSDFKDETVIHAGIAGPL